MDWQNLGVQIAANIAALAGMYVAFRVRLENRLTRLESEVRELRRTIERYERAR